MDWREEVVAAVEHWLKQEGGSGRKASWSRIGRAVRTAESGVFTVDVRGVEVGADQLESLRLADGEESGVEDGFNVLDAAQTGSSLTVRVAEFADPSDPHLWALKQPPTFLLEALRDRLRNLTDIPLGNRLAEGRPGGTRAHTSPPAGLLPAQQEVYRACLGSGLWLVWGPPGTGKTMVLTKAIGDLIADGKRVLLVSATNIAVDNALSGVMKGSRYEPGDLLRVGTPHIRAIAEDPLVSLPLIVRQRLKAVDDRRDLIARRMAEATRRARELARLKSRLEGFDPQAYRKAVSTLASTGGDLTACEASLARRTEERDAAAQAVRSAEDAWQATRDELAAAEDSRHLWQQVDSLRAEAAQLDEAASRAEGVALLAAEASEQARLRVAELERAPGRARWGKRKSHAAALTELAEYREREAELNARALSARSTADRQGGTLGRQAQELADAIPYSRERIRQCEAAQQQWAARVRDEREALKTATDRLGRAKGLRKAAARSQRLIERAESLGHPELHAQHEKLRREVKEDGAGREALEAEYRRVESEYERLARDAQGEIIGEAKLVATTLARFRTNKHVFDKHYDVVLVDEAGAATVPEVILAAARAQTTAVLLGDFMQLGAVVPQSVRDSERREVQRWLIPDVFEHCGIDSPATAQATAGCITLVEQNRFGHAVMQLANDLAYDGVLQAGQNIRRRPQDPGDPEIVLIDTDGLGDLAVPRLTGAASGWWPAGVLLSRALAELHHESSGSTGIVTPYTKQAAATLEALRDVEAGGQAPLAEVGTAHRFQGREFPVVVFDTVEAESGRKLWMSRASRGSKASTWHRNGVRLFNVAVTRVKTRLYLIGSWSRLKNFENDPALALHHVARRLSTPQMRVIPARALIAPPGDCEAEAMLGAVGNDLAQVLARHVTVQAVDSEREFFEAFQRAVRSARHSIWLWSPWVFSRVRSILPELKAAVQRGVRVVVFVRGESDGNQREHSDFLRELRAAVPTVVRIHEMHQKIVVVDEQTVMLGSLNTLSHRSTREIMTTIDGGYFARRILKEEHAEPFSHPPSCPHCRRNDVDIRRGAKGHWYWRCCNSQCPHGTGQRAWKQPVDLNSRNRKPRGGQGRRTSS
ncbi:AAA domain-containing protein [Streptomyces winkii]|uniref:AAA domain-containing protein n=1 Tax=Streptomyces winkii TaxID=3051178 RepID=UPI0028D2F6CB|nr:AAA domain-containing protein [Streptomyces sp. DSM 40971]